MSLPLPTEVTLPLDPGPPRVGTLPKEEALPLVRILLTVEMPTGDNRPQDRFPEAEVTLPTGATLPQDHSPAAEASLLTEETLPLDRSQEAEASHPLDPSAALGATLPMASPSPVPMLPMVSPSPDPQMAEPARATSQALAATARPIQEAPAMVSPSSVHRVGPIVLATSPALVAAAQAPELPAPIRGAVDLIAASLVFSMAPLAQTALAREALAQAVMRQVATHSAAMAVVDTALAATMLAATMLLATARAATAVQAPAQSSRGLVGDPISRRHTMRWAAVLTRQSTFTHILATQPRTSTLSTRTWSATATGSCRCTACPSRASPSPYLPICTRWLEAAKAQGAVRGWVASQALEVVADPSRLRWASLVWLLAQQ